MFGGLRLVRTILELHLLQPPAHSRECPTYFDVQVASQNVSIASPSATQEIQKTFDVQVVNVGTVMMPMVKSFQMSQQCMTRILTLGLSPNEVRHEELIHQSLSSDFFVVYFSVSSVAEERSYTNKLWTGSILSHMSNQSNVTLESTFQLPPSSTGVSPIQTMHGPTPRL